MINKPRIAMFASSLVSSYWNGAATYYRGIVKALAERGHFVMFFEPDAFERQLHRDIPNPEWAEVVVFQPTEQGVERALDRARDADVIVKASGVGIFDELLERAVLEVGTANRQGTIFWDVDAPATLERVKDNPNDPFRDLISRYDFIFTYGGGDPVIEAYKCLGAAECVPIYNAVDPDTHRPTARDDRFTGTLGFLGNRMPDREERVDEFFFAPARQMPECKFVLGGSGWGQHAPSLDNIRYVGHVGTVDHNAFNCSSLAVLNISRESMARFGFSPATRVFEAAGAAACLITDEWPGIDMFLEPDLEVLVASNGKEVVDHLQKLTPTRARAIGEAARKRVLRNHTYQHRAVQVESLLSGAVVG